MVENTEGSGPKDQSGNSPSPRVSICMPVFNGENFIEEALDSISQQDFEDYELIVTDNASTDATEAIVRRYAASDKRIRYFRNEINIGAAENYNLGFSHARGDYIKWAAHDDMLGPDFLKKMVRILDDDPTVSIAFARVQSIDEGGRAVGIPDRWVMCEQLDERPEARFLAALTSSGGCYPIFGLFRGQQLSCSSLHSSNYYGSDHALIAEMMLFGKLRIDETAVFLNRAHSERSVTISDPRKRARWQNRSAGRFASLERAHLLRHLLKIAGRHSELRMEAG